MKVYHGSHVEIDEIDLSKSEISRDFGLGFYVTKLLQQAEYWAARKGRENKTKGVVNEYVFRESAFIGDYYKTLRFADYSGEWLDFVVKNRRNATLNNVHDYDIVEGPVANDDIATRILVYLKNGVSKSDFLEELKFKRDPSHQIVFCTQRSLRVLEKSFKKMDFNEITIDDAVVQSLVVDYNMNEDQATKTYFKSKTYSLLLDEKNGYSDKPWQEIYAMLKQELN